MSDLDKQLYLYKQLIQVVGLDVYQYHSESIWSGNELSHTVRKISLNLRVLRVAIPKPYSKQTRQNLKSPNRDEIAKMNC